MHGNGTMDVVDRVNLLSLRQQQQQKKKKHARTQGKTFMIPFSSVAKWSIKSEKSDFIYTS
jgi:hypothetical protein